MKNQTMWRVTGLFALANQLELQLSRTTGTDWKKVFANWWNRKKITKKSHAGRGPETIWEISINISGRRKSRNIQSIIS
jgi:hypothetical protein